MSRGWVGVKACPPGVGGAVSSFGAAERSTMTPSIRFACLTNGSPAVIVAGSRAPLVDKNGGRRRICGDGDAYPCKCRMGKRVLMTGRPVK